MKPVFACAFVFKVKPRNEFNSQKISAKHSFIVAPPPVPKWSVVPVDSDQFFHVVLIEPEIAANTGNIGRTCVGLRTKLHLVGQLGYSITDRRLKRAGLDYWPYLDFVHHPTWEDWWREIPDPTRVFFLSTKAKKSLYQTSFRKGDWLVFGRETRGLEPALLAQYSDQTLRIPMEGPIRSLNIATAVAIVLFEGYRQTVGQ